MPNIDFEKNLATVADPQRPNYVWTNIPIERAMWGRHQTLFFPRLPIVGYDSAYLEEVLLIQAKPE